MAQLTGAAGPITMSGPGAGTATTSSVDNTAVLPMGSRAMDALGGEWIYLTGVASTVAGSVVTYDENGLTTLIVANAIGPVAVAGAATVASTFGWYCVRSPRGGLSVSVDAGIVDNAKAYIDGTAGRADDTVVAGDQIDRFVFRGTDTANFALAQFDYPSVSDSLG